MLNKELIYVLLNWDQRGTSGENFDLDLMLLLLDINEKIISNENFIFFNNTASKCKSIILEKQSDNGCEVEDEKIKIHLSTLKENVNFLDILITIHELEDKNFGQVKNAIIKLIDKNQIVLFEENLSEEFSSFSLCKLRLRKSEAGWKIDGISPIRKQRLEDVISSYGIKIKKDN